MKKTYILILAAILWLLAACGYKGKYVANDEVRLEELRSSLQMAADSFPGEVGIALITDRGDTLTVNNEAKYPLMSVFKLHQAIALCNLFERTGQSIDSVVSIPRKDLNPDTWSPMLKDHPEDMIEIPIHQLLTYTLTLSDNNASNWIFERLQPVCDTDSFIATLIPLESFSIRYTEAEMAKDHSRSYENRTSPLGAAMLIDRLYTDPEIDTVCGTGNAGFIRTTLDGCETGQDRIAAPLKRHEGIVLGHKTGSGYRDNGILCAHNDVGFVRLPDRRHYSLAVFVKDFNGDETEAAEAIARISGLVYSSISGERP